jgi:hypothetical protein
MSAFDKAIQAAQRGARQSGVEEEKKTPWAVDLAKAIPRGLEGGIQGIYNFADYATGDILPDYDERLLGRSETMVGGFAEGAVQFMTGFIPIAGQLGKAGQVARLASAGAKSKRFAKMAKRRKRAADIGAGAAADFLMFDGQEARLSNLMEEFNFLDTPVSEYLAAEDDDNEAEGRFKNAIEGLFIEAGMRGFGGVFRSGIKAMKEARRAKLSEDPETALRAMYDTILKGLDKANAGSGIFRATDDKSFDRYVQETASQRALSGEGGNLSAYDFTEGWLKTEAGQDSAYRPLLEQLLKDNAETLKNTGFFGAGGKDFDALGRFYQFDDGSAGIRVSGSRKKFLEAKKDSETTFLHETLHAVTAVKLEDVFQLNQVKVALGEGASNKDVFFEQLKRIEEIAKNKNVEESFRGIASTYLKAVMGNTGYKNVADVDIDKLFTDIASRAGDSRNRYGLTNLHEFVVETISNPKFFRELEGGINPAQRGMLAQMLHWIGQMLGVKENLSGDFGTIVRSSLSVARAQEKDILSGAYQTGNFNRVDELQLNDKADDASFNASLDKVDANDAVEMGDTGRADYEGFEDYDGFFGDTPSKIEEYGMGISTRQLDPDFGLEEVTPASEVLIKDPLNEDAQFSELGKVKAIDLEAINLDQLPSRFEQEDIVEGAKKITEEERAFEAKRKELAKTPVKVNTKKQDFTISVEGGKKVTVKANSVSYPEFPEFNFFVRKKGDIYELSESKTGRVLGGAGAKTRKQTIENGRNLLNKVGAKKVAEIIAEDTPKQRPATVGKNALAIKLKDFRKEKKSAYVRYLKMVRKGVKSPSKVLDATFTMMKTNDGRTITMGMRHRAARRLLNEDLRKAKLNDKLFTKAELNSRKEALRKLDTLRTRLEEVDGQKQQLVRSFKSGFPLYEKTGRKNYAQSAIDAVEGGVDFRLGVFDEVNRLRPYKTKDADGNIVTEEMLVSGKTDTGVGSANARIRREAGDTKQILNEGSTSQRQTVREVFDNAKETHPSLANVQAKVEDQALQKMNLTREEVKNLSPDDRALLLEEARMLSEARRAKHEAVREKLDLNDKEYDEFFGEGATDKLIDKFRNDPRGGEEALRNILKSTSSSAGVLHVMRTLVRHLGEAKESITKDSDLAQTTQDLVDALGGNAETFNALARSLGEGTDAFKQLRNEQAAIKMTMDALAVDLQAQAVKFQNDGMLNVTDGQRVEFLEQLDRLYEVSRLWVMYGKEASKTLRQRRPLLKGVLPEVHEAVNQGGMNNREVATQMPTNEARSRYLAGKTTAKRFDQIVEEVATATNSQHLVNDKSINPVVATKVAKGIHGSKGMSMILEYWTNSLLYGPTTQAVNIFGNGLTFGLRAMELTAGSVATGQFELARAAFGAAFAFDNWRESYRLMMRTFKEGNILTQGSAAFKDNKYDVNRITSSNLNDMTPLNLTPQGTLRAGMFDLFGKYSRVPSSLLSAGDEFFKQLNYRYHVKTMLAYEGAVKKGFKDLELRDYVMTKFKSMENEGRAYNQENMDINFYNSEIKPRLEDQNEPEFNAVLANKEYEAYKEGKYVNKDGQAMTREIAEKGESRTVMGAAALKFARENTFTDDLDEKTVFGVMAKHLNQLKMNPATSFISFIVPFVRTPTNILKFALDRTPVGVAPRALIGDGGRFIGKHLMGIQTQYKSALMSKDPAIRAQTMGQLTTAVGMGSTLMYYLGTNQEFFTGAGPQDADRRKALQMGGWQPYSVKVGDKYYSYQRADPMSTVLGLYVDMFEAYKYHDVDEDTMSYLSGVMMLSFINNIANKSFLQGIDNMLQVLSDPIGSTTKAGGDIAAGFVPNYFQQIKNIETTRELKEARTMWDRIIKRTPYSDELMPKRNALGETITVDNPPYGLGVISPVYIRNVSDDPLDQEIARLNKGFSVPKAKLMNAFDMRQSRNEEGQTAYDRYQQLTSEVELNGRSLRKALSDLMKTPYYKTLEEGTSVDLGKGIQPPRVRAMQKIITRYRRFAKSKMLKEFPELQEEVDALIQRRRQL